MTSVGGIAAGSWPPVELSGGRGRLAAGHTPHADTWLERAKERAGIQVEGLGFHGQKRAGVRRKDFRVLPNRVREKLTGTSARTLDSVYDDVSVDDMHDALQQLNAGT